MSTDFNKQILSFSKQTVFHIPLFIYIVLISFSFLAFPLATGLDESYFAALNYLDSSQYHFGKDIETTYGPLGFICSPLKLHNHILISSLISLGLALLNATVIVKQFISTNSIRVKIAFLALWLAAIAFYNPQTRDYQALVSFLLCLTCFFINPCRNNISLLFIASLIASFSLFVKFNNAVIMLINLTISSLVLWFKFKDLKKLLYLNLSFFLLLTSFLICTVFTNFSEFISFIINSMDVASAYSTVMSSVERSNLPLIGSVIFTLLLLGALIYYLKNKSNMIYPLILFLVPIVIAFKHSFIREGNIAKFPYISFVFLAITLLFCRKKQDFIFIALASIILGSFIPAKKNECFLRDSLCLSGLESFQELINIDNTYKKIDEKSKTNLKLNKLPDSWLELLKETKNTVDCIPIELFYCFANNLNWQPNPAIQLAYAITPKLDHWSAQHFNLNTAPNFILVGFPDCDWRHPFFTAPEAWRSIYSNYKSIDINKNIAQCLFKHRKQKLNETMTKLDIQYCGPEEWVPLPRGHNFLIAKIHMKESILGKVKKALYRIDPIYMDICYENSKYAYFRFLPNTASDGILISPLPKNLEDLNLLFSDKKITQTAFIKIHGPGLDSYQKKIGIEWFKTDYSSY